MQMQLTLALKNMRCGFLVAVAVEVSKEAVAVQVAVVADGVHTNHSRKARRKARRRARRSRARRLRAVQDFAMHAGR